MIVQSIKEILLREASRLGLPYGVRAYPDQVEAVAEMISDGWVKGHSGNYGNIGKEAWIEELLQPAILFLKEEQENRRAKFSEMTVGHLEKFIAVQEYGHPLHGEAQAILDEKIAASDAEKKKASEREQETFDKANRIQVWGISLTTFFAIISAVLGYFAIDVESQVTALEKRVHELERVRAKQDETEKLHSMPAGTEARSNTTSSMSL